MSIQDDDKPEEEVKFTKVSGVLTKTLKVLVSTPLQFTYYFFLILTFMGLFFEKEFSNEYYGLFLFVTLMYLFDIYKPLWQKDQD